MSKSNNIEVKRVKRIKQAIKKAKQAEREIPLSLGKSILSKYGAIKTNNKGKVKVYKHYSKNGKHKSKTGKRYDNVIAENKLIGFDDFQKHYYILPKRSVGNDKKLHLTDTPKMAKLGKLVVDSRIASGQDANIDEMIAQLEANIRQTEKNN